MRVERGDAGGEFGGPCISGEGLRMGHEPACDATALMIGVYTDQFDDTRALGMMQRGMGVPR